MTRARVEAAARQLGLPAGPRVPCPRCDATGLDVSEARLDAHLAAFFGRPPPPQEPPPPQRCGLCAGTGATTEAAVAVAERRAAEAADRFEQDLDRHAEAMTRSMDRLAGRPELLAQMLDVDRMSNRDWFTAACLGVVPPPPGLAHLASFQQQQDAPDEDTQ